MTKGNGPETHAIQRMRHESRRRILTVAEVVHLTPKMRRIIFHSPELADFKSLGADDHIKLVLPDGAGGSVMRDFTPRAYDNQRALLTIDFVVHGAGPATGWATHAKPGDNLEIGGPRGSQIVPDDFDWYLLIADETGLPAIGRRVEALRPAVPVVTIVVIDELADAQQFETAAAWTGHWVCRQGDGPRDAELLCAQLEQVSLPVGDGYVWIAAEASVAKALRAYVTEVGMHNPHWMRAAGYWQRGEIGKHVNLD